MIFYNIELLKNKKQNYLYYSQLFSKNYTLIHIYYYELIF